MGLNCVHWSPDLDVARSTLVKQGRDEKFQDWNMSGGSSESQLWRRERVTQPCAVNQPLLTPPKALSACLLILLQWIVSGNPGTESSVVLLRKHESGWERAARNVLWEDVPVCYDPTPSPRQMPPQPSMAGVLLLMPAVPVPHSRQLVPHTKAQQICYFLHLKGKKDN